MPRISVLTALIPASTLIAIGLSVLLIGHGDPGLVLPVAASTPAGCKPCMKPDGTESGKPNTAPNVTNLALDKTEIRLPCPDAEPASAPDSRVEVNVTADDADGDVLTYNYVISGGRIVGQGKKVVWDISKIRAGTYSITAGVDDGCGICGKTQTKMLTVQECVSTE